MVKDGQGSIIATDELGSGRLVRANACEFRFEVYPVPDADFYEVEVGRRGGVVYSRVDLETDDWIITFQLGRR